MTLEIAFDRIARSYDRQRAHSPEVSAQIGAAIAATAGSGARVLELGVGTGRIALPAIAAGCRVVGLDVSREMLGTARQNAAGEPGARLALIQADAASLPLAKASVDAILAVAVLHLIPDWRGALAEAIRVLRPGGVFIQGRDWRDPQSVAERLRGKLREAVMQLLPGSRPPGAGAQIAQALTRLGGCPEPEIIAARWTAYASPAGVLEAMAAREDSETWVLDDDMLARALTMMRAWAEATWDDLHADQAVEHRFVLAATRF